MIEQKLLRLEQMSSAEKIRYWIQEKPWHMDGSRLRLPRIKEVPAGQIKVDNGMVTRMPLVIGRPCFGQPTAFMRHGDGRLIYSPRRKSWHPTRCGRCPASQACQFVAEERLRSTPKVAELYRGAHVLLHDTTYSPEDQKTRRNRGFSSWADAAAAAAAALAETLVMFHYDQDYTDDDVDGICRAARASLDAKNGKAIELVPAREGGELEV